MSKFATGQKVQFVGGGQVMIAGGHDHPAGPAMPVRCYFVDPDLGYVRRVDLPEDLLVAASDPVQPTEGELAAITTDPAVPLFQL